MFPMSAVYDTRFAPSPTGMPTLGSARTAYLNYLMARATGGRFVLRVDDTDAARNVPGAVDALYAMMDYLGLDYDVTYMASKRLPRYRAVADALLKAGLAKRLDNGAVALDLCGAGMVDLVPRAVTDMVVGVMATGRDRVNAAANLVLLRSDGSPLYNFASAVDDSDDRTALVLRGVDMSSNTVTNLTVLMAMKAAGMDVSVPKFASLGLLLDPSTGRKLSKRVGGNSVLDLRDAGIPAPAVLNYVLRMGFGPVGDNRSNALMPTDAALSVMRTGAFNLNARPSMLDPAKLDAYARKYRIRL